MSIVTLNTQCLTFACKYHYTRATVSSVNPVHAAAEFNFFTDGKGNILSKAEDASYIFVDCEKRTVWCNMPTVQVPTFSAVLQALELSHPLIYAYIHAAHRNNEEMHTLLEKALVKLPVINIPMKTVFRMERINYKSKGISEMELTNPVGTFDHRSLQGFRMIGFTEDGSIAPVYERVKGDKTYYYQDFDEVRYGLMALHYSYSVEYPVPNPEEKEKVAILEMRELLRNQGNMVLSSFRVRADGAVRVYQRGVGVARWLNKLDIAQGSQFIFNGALEHILQPLGTEWDRGYTAMTIPLAIDHYYYRYTSPSLSGGLTTRNTRFRVTFKLDANGVAIPFESIKDMQAGEIVYQLTSSMRQGTLRSGVADCAEHEVKKPRRLGGGLFYGYYQCESYIASEDHRLTIDGSNVGTYPISSMNPPMIAKVLTQWATNNPELYNEITFERLVPKSE